jgi:hypothetical protein
MTIQVNTINIVVLGNFKLPFCGKSFRRIKAKIKPIRINGIEMNRYTILIPLIRFNN